MIERDGIAGLSHRAVAEQAGVSLASASYHFDGIDDLLATALNQAADDLIDALSADGDRSLAGLARLFVEEMESRRGTWIAEYELYLLTLRRPHLRAQALRWHDVIADTFAPSLTGRARQAFQATLEGICLHMLFQDPPWTAADIEQMLTLAWPE